MEHRPTIVALDSFPLDFDGLSWNEIDLLGQFVRYPRTEPGLLLERAAGAEILLVNKFQLTAANMSRLPDLRYVAVTATGTNNVDLEFCRKHQIAVTNVKDYSAPSVAQLVFSYMLYLATRVHEFDSAVKKGRWHESPDFCFGLESHFELAGKTLGIVGYGSIGRAVARIAEAFSMNVLIAKVPGQIYPAPEQIRRVEFKQVLKSADFLTLHIPLTPQTTRLINAESIALMKSTAVLINTGRGDLIDEAALEQALRAGRIGYACLDVVSNEPPLASNPVFTAPNTVITPHIAWSSRESRSRLMQETAANIRSYLRGERRNRLD